MAQGVFSDVITNATNSFFQITAFLGFILLLFGYIDYVHQGRLIEAITKSKKFQPLIGALLGIFPGCGGSILIMPLYVKGTVTFGTVIATTIATFGDSAFVVLAQAPKKFAIITLINFIIGTIAGYLVDHLNIKKTMPWARTKKRIINNKRQKTKLNNLAGEDSNTLPTSHITHIGHEAGDEIDIALHKSTFNAHEKWCHKVIDKYYLLFWFAITMGLAIGVFDFLDIDISLTFLGLNLDIYSIVGVIGTLIVIGYFICSRNILQGQTHEDVEHKLFSLKETFIHTAKETAFVGTWIFLAYLLYEVAVLFVGKEQLIHSITSASGIILVLLGVAIGIIPGCGPQIIFVSMHLKGSLPFAALLANSISQDGDALFPLIILDKKAALWTTIINSIWALVIGLLAYVIEIRFIR